MVVIAIIAILAAILFPVFARARENARRASCQSNLKQISLGVMQYTQDYDERLPLTHNGNFYGSSNGYSAWGLWMLHIHPYTKSVQIFRCPSSSLGESSVDFIGTPFGDISFPLMYNYGINQNILGYGLASIQEPARLVLAADSTGTVIDFPQRIYNANYPHSWWNVPRGIGPNGSRHLGGSNILFADGHVKFLSQRQAGPDPARSDQDDIADCARIILRPEDDRFQS